MSFDVGILTALIYGAGSFLSPCILPLVPSYLCFIAGLSLDELTAEGRPARASARIMGSALAFVAGFTAVFVAMGMTATAIGQTLFDYADPLRWIGGIVLVLFGLHFLGVYRIAFLDRQARAQVHAKPPGLIGAFVVGLAFAFGWTPCAGPILSQIVMIAGNRETIGQGGFLLLAYALGIGIPFLIAAAFAGAFMRFLQRAARHLGTVEKAMGVLLILSGIAFMFGWFNDLGFWLLQNRIGIPG